MRVLAEYGPKHKGDPRGIIELDGARQSLNAVWGESRSASLGALVHDDERYLIVDVSSIPYSVDRDPPIVGVFPTYDAAKMATLLLGWNW